MFVFLLRLVSGLGSRLAMVQGSMSLWDRAKRCSSAKRSGNQWASQSEKMKGWASEKEVCNGRTAGHKTPRRRDTLQSRPFAANLRLRIPNLLPLADRKEFLLLLCGDRRRNIPRRGGDRHRYSSCCLCR